MKWAPWVCHYCIAEICGVEIPSSLVEKLPGAHYIRVAKCDKRPIDNDWPNNPLKPDDEKLQSHLKAGGNYGVVGGKGLVILDADTEEIKDAADKHLPKTFTVQTPGSGGWHLYFFCDLEKPIRLYDKGKVNVGDVQGKGKMVIGPGCFHPNGSQYRILRNLPIANVTQEQLMETLGPWTVSEEKAEALCKTAKRETDLIKISMLDVFNIGLSRLKKQGDEYYGPHPIHGSTTGRNFWVNFKKNVFHCFRHGTGGGPLTWLAVEEGIIRCEEAVPGALRGETFKKVLEALERRGFNVPGYLRKLEGLVESVDINGYTYNTPTNGYKLETDNRIPLIRKCQKRPITNPKINKGEVG
jgi:hypothetical protein